MVYALTKHFGYYAMFIKVDDVVFFILISHCEPKKMLKKCYSVKYDQIVASLKM